MASHQLQNEPGHRGISEAISVDHEELMGTKMQQTDHSVTSTTVEQADVVEVGGVK